MVRLGTERVLLIGDIERQVQEAVAQGLPGSQITAVASFFDGIAELGAHQYTTVLAAAEPIERRPEAAVRTLRELAGEARVVLFGHPTLEPLSRKMLEFGCDDYFVTPAKPAELQRLLSEPRLRIAPPAKAAASAEETPIEAGSSNLHLAGLPLAEVFLSALTEQPGNAPAAAIAQLNGMLTPAVQLIHTPAGSQAPPGADGRIMLTHAVKAGDEEFGQVHLLLPPDEDVNAARRYLSRLADLVGKTYALQERHNRLQKLAITDELTGLYNGRYFRHFLARILERAKEKLFPVTLLIFDIDNFKQYNDHYGHGVGDEILKETANLIRRCCREHDLVARLGGDEFAVVFWEKEGPRQPKDPQAGKTMRPPQTPEQVMDRFKRLLARKEFKGLGESGQGTLTISGGVAVFPYHASSMDQLIELADRRLVFGAKQSGKNRIFLVGSENQEETE